jgi:antitoxin MazE
MLAKTRIVQIGNSRGIRVPKVLLEHAALPDEVELQAEHGRLIVRAARGPRAGWAAAAKAMHERGEDHLILDAPTTSQFDRQEWKWR